MGFGPSAVEGVVAMRVVVTGNMGYVGSVLVRHLRAAYPHAELVGFDAGFFSGSLTEAGPLPETWLDSQHFGDVRRFPVALLHGADAVVHLAAISNDPMGQRFADVTDAVNFRASVALAEASRDAGVRRFVFASSCSVYGAGGDAARREDDVLNPQTAYARSKIATEEFLRLMARDTMAVVCLRFATACGWSPRLRLDLVLNDFVASALTTGEISVLSDGTPWRPLIDVEDMGRAVEWAIDADRPPGEFLAVNVGHAAGNVQVRGLARLVADANPGTRVAINAEAGPDTRSYQVDFALWRRLAPAHQPQVTLSDSVRRLAAGLRTTGFADAAFRRSPLMRLHALERLIAGGVLTQTLERG